MARVIRQVQQGLEVAGLKFVDHYTTPVVAQLRVTVVYQAPHSRAAMNTRSARAVIWLVDRFIVWSIGGTTVSPAQIRTRPEANIASEVEPDVGGDGRGGGPSRNGAVVALTEHHRIASSGVPHPTLLLDQMSLLQMSCHVGAGVDDPAYHSVVGEGLFERSKSL